MTIDYDTYEREHERFWQAPSLYESDQYRRKMRLRVRLSGWVLLVCTIYVLAHVGAMLIDLTF
jgi:hypothetical protein